MKGIPKLKSLKLRPKESNSLRRSFGKVWSLLSRMLRLRLFPLIILATPLIILLALILFLLLSLLFLFGLMFYLISLRPLLRSRGGDKTIEAEYWIEPEDKL